MEKIINLLIALFSCYLVKAQGTIPIKEQFDNLHSNYPIVSSIGSSHQGIIPYIYENTNPFESYNYGENIGFALESFLTMYKTTKDKAYLIKFINESLIIIANRRSNNLFTDITYQDANNPNSGESQYYKDGMLVWAMAHFCFMVLEEYPALNEQICPVDVLEIPQSSSEINNLPNMPNYTYGSIATWIAARLIETMESVNQYFWIDYNTGFRNPFEDDDLPFEINMQSTFGAGMLYLGLLANELPELQLQSYLDKGAALARLYKKNINVIDQCECGETLPIPSVLIHRQITNSYYWFHRGWKTEDRYCIRLGIGTCDPFMGFSTRYDKYTEYIEDISHAITTLVLVHVAYELDIFTNNAYAFTEEDMTRFKNMFTKHIFNGNLEQPQFHSAVNGMDGPIYPESESNEFNVFKFSSLGFMPLYQFDDGDGPSVYEIIMRFYENEVMISPGNISDGQKSYGLAHTVAAQWEKECVDVTLYNRQMVYDQDLFAKGKLFIAPEKEEEFIHQLGDKSFAAPEITSNTFTIEPNVNVTLSAGESITLESGFTAEAGSEFTAEIQALLCSNDGRYANFSDDDLSRPSNNQSDKQIYTEPPLMNNEIRINAKNDLTSNEIKVFPNPCNDYFQLSVPGLEYDHIEVTLLNPMGLKQSLIPESSTLINNAWEYPFNTQLLNSGVYYIQISQQGVIKEVKKILIVK